MIGPARIRFHRAEQAQNGISAFSGVRADGGCGEIVKFQNESKESGEAPRNRTENPQINSLLHCQLS